MTTLENLTTKQIVITRLTTVSGNKKAYVTTTADFAEIQPLSLEKTILVNGQMGKTFKCYVDPSVSILEGDLLREVSNGNKYKVKTGGVSRRTFGSIDYTEIIMEQVN